jgi:hypothetical protein
MRSTVVLPRCDFYAVLLSADRLQSERILLPVELMLSLPKLPWHLAIIAVFTAAGSAWAATDWDAANKFYKDGEYSRAAGKLESLLRGSPSNATAHYMLGNCLLRMKKTSLAKAEYQSAIRLDSTGTLEPYCQRALSALAGKKEAPTTTARAQGALSIGTAAPVSQPVDTDTLRLITERDQRFNRMVAEGEGRVKVLETEMKERIAANGAPAWSGSPACQRSVKYYDPELENKVIREEYAPKIETVKAEYKRRSDEILAVYKQRYGDLDAMAGRTKNSADDGNSAVASATASTPGTIPGAPAAVNNGSSSGALPSAGSGAACVRTYQPASRH